MANEARSEYIILFNNIINSDSTVRRLILIFGSFDFQRSMFWILKLFVFFFFCSFCSFCSFLKSYFKINILFFVIKIIMRMMRERINYTVLYDGDDEDSR